MARNGLDVVLNLLATSTAESVRLDTLLCLRMILDHEIVHTRLGSNETLAPALVGAFCDGRLAVWTIQTTMLHAHLPLMSPCRCVVLHPTHPPPCDVKTPGPVLVRCL
jgi:hypothetical protein